MGGTVDPDVDLPSNIGLLCGSGTTGCHGWVERNRTAAEAEGWLVPRRDPRRPADVPVCRRGRLELLADDGQVHPIG